MNKRNRLIILTICIALFLFIAPYIALYSMGYRINFETWKVAATGGIYVRTFPAADQIIFDSKIFKKPGIFNNAVFVQDLLPKQHSVLIQKEGYFDYQKTLEITEKEVSKVENIILFKNNIIFDELLKNSESFSFSPDKKFILIELSNTNSLDFSYFDVSNPQNQKTYSIPAKYTSVLDVIWSSDSKKALIKTENTSGIAFYIFDFSKAIQQKTALSYLDVNSKEVSFNPQDSEQIFYKKNNTLYSLKNNKSTLVPKTENSTTPAQEESFTMEGYKLLQSPDNKNIIYYNSSEIYLHSLNVNKKENNIKLFSSNYPEIITECYWLNNDYIIFQSGNKIIASEIDYRGNINAVQIPQTYPPSPESKTPKFIFNSHDNKVYILTNKTLYSSEKILP